MENGILLLYNEGTGQSSYFDGSRITKLPEDWYSITFDAAGNYIYWSDDAIWRVSGGDLSAARQIDTGIDRSSVYFLDPDDLLYQKTTRSIRSTPMGRLTASQKAFPLFMDRMIRSIISADPKAALSYSAGRTEAPLL